MDLFKTSLQNLEEQTNNIKKDLRFFLVYLLNALVIDKSIETALLVVRLFFKDFIEENLKECKDCGRFGVDEQDGYSDEDKETWYCYKCWNLKDFKSEWRTELAEEYKNE